ncbi:MAG: hypothetical protein D6811_12335 [Alphaproteobacteria bacterium]|nr:MAG: hypothetical protein D6811_12335 [Alphaproteobacteria bacterium]
MSHASIPRLLLGLFLAVHAAAATGQAAGEAEQDRADTHGPRAGKVCVTNATGQRLLFAAEIAGAERRLAWLDPGARLCSAPGAAPQGMVGVFESEEALEGCSRRISAGDNLVLEAYASFDNCRWADRE